MIPLNTFQQSNRLITINQLSLLLSKSRVTIWRWTRAGILPAGITVNGKTLGWKESVIKEWLADHEG